MKKNFPKIGPKICPKICLLAFFLVPVSLLAHTGNLNLQGVLHGFSPGFLEGFLHPLLGLDHLIVLIALGLYLGLNFRTLSVFTVLLMLSAFTAYYFAIPNLKLAIGGSVIFAGLLLFLPKHMLFPMLVTCLLAVVQGLVHGREIPSASSPLLFIMGMGLASCLILLSASTLASIFRPRYSYFFGGAIVAAGVIALFA